MQKGIFACLPSFAVIAAAAAAGVSCFTEEVDGVDVAAGRVGINGLMGGAPPAFIPDIRFIPWESRATVERRSDAVRIKISMCIQRSM